MSALAAWVVCALSAGDVQAHHSASASGAFLVPRSTACSEPKLDDPRCVGPARAEAALLEALERGPSGADSLSQLHRAAIAAAYYDLQAAVGPLRRLLAKKADARELWSLRAEAAYALAQLGDRESVAAIRSLVEALETAGSGSLWIDTLDALATLDAEEASRYAVSFLERLEDVSTFRLSMPGGTAKDRVLAYLQPGDRAALPALRRLTDVARVSIRDDRAFCKLMAARMRAGDTALRDETRRVMTGSYSGTRAASCDAAWLGVFGAEPADATVLVRHLGRPDAGLDHGVTNVAYGRILELLARMHAREPHAGVAERRRIESARRTLREALVERADWPHVRDPRQRTWAQHYPVYQAAGLAALGDRAALAELRAFIEDPNDESGTAWLAAYWGLRLRLPDIEDPVAALMRRGASYHNTSRSGIYQDLRVRVLEQWLADRPHDPRWTVALVDAELDMAERSLAAFSRSRPTEACRLVPEASRQATRASAERGLSTLLVLGATCRPELEAAALDVRAPSKVRGTALELMAVLGWPRVSVIGEQAYSQTNMPPYVQRARRMIEAVGGRRR